MIKNMKIRSRMLVSYAIIIIISMIASILALFMLHDAGSNLTSFYDVNYTVTDQSWFARRAMQAARADLFQSILEVDVPEIEKYADSAQSNIDGLHESLSVLRSIFNGDIALIDNADSLLNEAKTYREQISDLVLENRNDEAFVIMKNNYIPMLDQVTDLLSQISAAASTEARQMVDDGARSVTVSTIIVCVIAGASIALAFFLGLYISNSIRKPLAEIELAAGELSVGNLHTDISYTAKDELGSLADSMRTTTTGLSGVISDLSYLLNEIASGNFNSRTRDEEVYAGDFRPLLLAIRTMNADLSDTLTRINQASDQVATGSDQVASGAQALSQGSTEQASSVEELAAMISEISGQVNRNAENAQSASRRATETGDQIIQSNQRMQDMIAAMNEITTSSQEIGKIIKTIEDIAFQTNILALNAAVEAARAGEAGKGFAVVADEVRNLASKSSEASKNTAALIERSLRSVEDGAKIADETAQSLLTSVEGAKQVTEIIDSISQASTEQASSITQVMQGIDQISSVVQINSATAEESAAASEELSGQAQLLKDLVGRFMLKSDGGSSSSQPESGRPQSMGTSQFTPPSSEKY